MKKAIDDIFTILVVDDSPGTVEVITRNLESRKFRVYTSGNVNEAITLIIKHHVDLVITDLNMPGAHGIELVKFIQENYSETETLVITGYPSVKSAVKSIQLGAHDYLTKPFTNEELLDAVDKALTKVKENRKLKVQNQQNQVSRFGIIGESRAMTEVFKTLEKIIKVKNATVLITGESGTGKEVVARAIHYHSKQSSDPFIPVNCAAIPDELLESELFGYTKGAFTGALESKQGFFEIAHGGSIFLDEISNTSLSMQAKLLRVLQEKEFYAVGNNKPIKVDLRIMAATNVDLPSMITKGKFREDLYYRLNVINLQLPPLYKREDDILLFLNEFSHKYARETGREIVPEFSDEAIKALKNYRWPGNIRELQNLIFQLIVMKDSNTIEITDLPVALRFQIEAVNDPNRTLKEVESEHIRLVLESVNQNLSEASRILGIDRKTIREKLKKRVRN